MNTSNNFDAQIKILESEIQKATLEFQSKEKQVEDLRREITAAKSHAKEDERTAAQKSSELVRAEREMTVLKTKVEGYHSQLDSWNVTRERARQDMERIRSRK